MIKFLFLSLIFLTSCVARTNTVIEGVERKTKPLTFMDKIKGKTKGDVIFATAYGEIEKGASMPEVMNLLGNPYHINFYQNTETWCYSFGNNKKLFVHFVNGSVVDVKEKEKDIK